MYPQGRHVSGHLFVSKDTFAGSGHSRGDPVRCLTLILFFSAVCSFSHSRIPLLGVVGSVTRGMPLGGGDGLLMADLDTDKVSGYRMEEIGEKIGKRGNTSVPKHLRVQTDDRLPCFLEYCSCLSTKCQFSYLIVGECVLHRRSELLFLSFIYSSAQSASISSPNSRYYLPRSFTIQSTFISTQIFSILIALIRSAIPPAISFDLIFIFLLRSKSTYVFLTGSHKPCANYSQKFNQHLSPSI